MDHIKRSVMKRQAQLGLKKPPKSNMPQGRQDFETYMLNNNSAQTSVNDMSAMIHLQQEPDQSFIRRRSHLPSNNKEPTSALPQNKSVNHSLAANQNSFQQQRKSKSSVFSMGVQIDDEVYIGDNFQKENVIPATKIDNGERQITSVRMIGNSRQSQMEKQANSMHMNVRPKSVAKIGQNGGSNQGLNVQTMQVQPQPQQNQNKTKSKNSNSNQLSQNTNKIGPALCVMGAGSQIAPEKQNSAQRAGTVRNFFEKRKHLTRQKSTNQSEVQQQQCAPPIIMHSTTKSNASSHTVNQYNENSVNQNNIIQRSFQKQSNLLVEKQHSQGISSDKQTSKSKQNSLMASINSATGTRTTSNLNGSMKQDKQQYPNSSHQLKRFDVNSLQNNKQNPKKPAAAGIQMLPSTPKVYRTTKRELFARRMSLMNRPILVITFQGVIGDFTKLTCPGMATFQIKKEVSNAASAPQGAGPEYLNSDEVGHMQLRNGSLEGLRYLSQHFQIVVISREEVADNWSSDAQCGTQTALGEQTKYIKQLLAAKSESIQIDAFYSSTIHARKQTLWDDYQQIYLDFGMTNHKNQSDKKAQEKVLFIQSIANDFVQAQQPYQSHNEAGGLDTHGYFLFDFACQPVVPLTRGLPLSTCPPVESTPKTKVIEKNTAKHMPVTLLIPHVRTGLQSLSIKQQGTTSLTFIQIAKSIMLLGFLGQKKQAKLQTFMCPVSNIGTDKCSEDLLRPEEILSLKESQLKIRQNDCISIVQTRQVPVSLRLKTNNKEARQGNESAVDFAQTQAETDGECMSQKGGTQYSSDLESSNSIACVKRSNKRTVFVQQRNNDPQYLTKGDQSGENTPTSLAFKPVNAAGLTPNQEIHHRKSPIPIIQSGSAENKPRRQRPPSSNSENLRQPSKNFGTKAELRQKENEDDIALICRSRGDRRMNYPNANQSQMSDHSQNSSQVKQLDFTLPSTTAIPCFADGDEIMENINDEYVIKLNDQFFNGMSWVQSNELLHEAGVDKQRKILGMRTAQSDLVWRFFGKQMKERIELRKLYDARMKDVKTVIEHMLDTEKWQNTKKDKIQQVCQILLKSKENHPLSAMLHRNIRYFNKMEFPRKTELIKQLEEWKKFNELKQKVQLGPQNINMPYQNMISYMNPSGHKAFEQWLKDESINNQFIMLGMDQPQHYYQMQAKLQLIAASSNNHAFASNNSTAIQNHGQNASNLKRNSSISQRQHVVKSVGNVSLNTSQQMVTVPPVGPSTKTNINYNTGRSSAKSRTRPPANSASQVMYLVQPQGMSPATTFQASAKPASSSKKQALHQPMTNIVGTYTAVSSGTPQNLRTKQSSRVNALPLGH